MMAGAYPDRSAFDCGPGFVRTGGRFGPAIVQVLVRLADALPSDTETVTEYVPALPIASVPEMSPVAALTVSGAGKPVALYVSESPSGSLPISCSDTLVPSTRAWFPGSARVGAWLTCATIHANDWLADSTPSEAVAVI